jgi:RNA polymerase sigma factor (TIGR02999 family)
MGAMGLDDPQDIDHLVGEFRNGDTEAAGKLVELLYPQLRRMALVRMVHEKSGHTWQPTALVNELYLELTKVGKLERPSTGGAGERSAFLGFVSHLMRRLLIRHSRRASRQAEKLAVEDLHLPEGKDPLLETQIQVDVVMAKLESVNPRLRAVVEMRVYEGLSGDAIAERLGCTRRTVIRDWNFAKQFLAEELASHPSA